MGCRLSLALFTGTVDRCPNFLEIRVEVITAQVFSGVIHVPDEAQIQTILCGSAARICVVDNREYTESLLISQVDEVGRQQEFQEQAGGIEDAYNEMMRRVFGD